ncbi:MAG: division/cell wall cluster transcriptional repressor MraZ [Lachnospiraceae bacterium]|nr:division/cell wall cluster transcriptional repressor MraZ [Lachnospiraceae bacterium]
MFMGEYNHTIDPKGRLIIPAKFREALGNEFIVSRGMDGCLFVHCNEGWEEFQKKIEDLPVTVKQTRIFARYFFSGATEAELDKQGRILLPQNLREFAGLAKDVVLVGVGKRVEIWDKERYENSVSNVDMDEVTQAMIDLGLSI